MTDGLTMIAYTDPSHGWLELTPEHRDALGLKPEDFTDFSYIEPVSGTIYAEEDCDAAVVLVAHLRTFGCLPAIRETHGPHAFCRSLPRLPRVSPKWREARAYLDAHGDAAVNPQFAQGTSLEPGQPCCAGLFAFRTPTKED
jgi:hypothetical protein